MKLEITPITFNVIAVPIYCDVNEPPHNVDVVTYGVLDDEEDATRYAEDHLLQREETTDERQHEDGDHRRQLIESDPREGLDDTATSHDFNVIHNGLCIHKYITTIILNTRAVISGFYN